MQTTSQHPTPLDEYVDLRTLLPTVSRTFPSQDSLKWFIRQHKDELAQSGALITLTGRLLFHPARFQVAAVEIGRSAVRPSK